VDRERTTEVAGSSGETEVGCGFYEPAALAHRGRAVDGRRGADQHRLGDVDAPGHDVQAVVHSVGEVDVGVAGRAVHDFVTRGAAPACRMTGEITRAAISL